MALPGETPEQEAERLKRQAMGTRVGAPPLSVLPQAGHTGPEDPRGMFASANARKPQRDSIRRDMSTQEAAAKRAADFSLGVNNNPEVAAMVGQAQDTGNRYAGEFGDVARRAAGLSQEAGNRGLGGYRGNLSGYTEAAKQAAQSRQMQTGAFGQLQQFAQGPIGPSSAEAQLTQATNANTQNALALARSGRGMGGGAAAMRQAIGQNAATQQQAVGQMAQLRADENTAFQQQRLNALTQMGGLATQTATTDQGLANLGLDRAKYESDVALKGQTLNDQSAQAWANQQAQALNAGLGSEVGAQTQALNIQEMALGARQAEYNAAAAQAGAAQAAAVQQQQRRDAFTNAAIGTAGTVIGGIASDERSKQDITPLGRPTDSGLGTYGAEHPAAAPTQAPGAPPSLNSVKPNQARPVTPFAKMPSLEEAKKAASDKRAQTIGSTAGKAVGGVAGGAIAGPVGAVAGSLIGGFAGKALGKIFSDVRSKEVLVPLGGGGGYDAGEGFIPREQERIPAHWERDPHNPSRLRDPYEDIGIASHSNDGSAFEQLQAIAAKYPGAKGIATTPEAVERYANAKLPESSKAEPLESRQPRPEPNQSLSEENMSRDTEPAPARKGARVAGSALKRFARDNAGPILSEGDALLADSARHSPGSAYRYKDAAMPGAAPGVHTGPMAQDLETHPVTASLVSTDPATGLKKVDGQRAAMTGLAQNHSQQNQIDKLNAEIARLSALLDKPGKSKAKADDPFVFKPSTNYGGL